MLKEMRYIYTVYEEQSFSKAARKLYISQPALSAMVKKAEREWNIDIFDRTTSPITLTKEGEYFIKVSKKIIDLTEEMQHYFAESSKGTSGSLTFGGSAYFCTTIFSGMVQHFQEMYPAIRINWQERRNTELAEQLIRGKIDLAFEVDKIENEQIQSICVGREEVILAVPKKFPVNDVLSAYSYRPWDSACVYKSIKEAPEISIEYFRNDAFVLLREGNDSYARTIQICRNAGFFPEIVLKVDSVLTAYQLAVAGLGIAPVRDSLLLGENSANLCYYRLKDPLSLRDIMLYYRSSEAPTGAVATFLSYIRNFIDTI